MKLNKQILLYIIVIVLSYLFFYKFFDKTSYDVSSRDILKLDASLWQEKLQVYTLSKWYDYIWFKQGFKETIVKQLKNDTKTKKYIYTKDTNVICVNTECFRFLAIVKKGNTEYATFYAESFPKNHIKLFKINSLLYSKLFIKDIKDDMVILSEFNTTQEWKFFFFDVNLTKYKPKDNNETHL